MENCHRIDVYYHILLLNYIKIINNNQINPLILTNKTPK